MPKFPKIIQSSIFATGFLVLSLITAVSITSNPLKAIAFQSYARVSGTANANRIERQALKEGGDKWKVNGKQCVGSQCYLITLGQIKSDAQVNQDVITSAATDQQKAKCLAVVAGGAKFDCNTPTGFAAFANAYPLQQAAIDAAQPKAVTNADCGTGFLAEGTVCRNPRTGASYDYNNFAFYFVATGGTDPGGQVKKLCIASGFGACDTASSVQNFALSQLPTSSQKSDSQYYTSENVKAAINAGYVPTPGGNTQPANVNSGGNAGIGGKNSSGQAYVAEGPAGSNGYYMSCVNSSCPTGQKSSYNGGCACLITPQTQNSGTQTYLAPAPPETKGYYLSCVLDSCLQGQKSTYNGGCACLVAPQGPSSPSIPQTITIKTADSNTCSNAANGRYWAFLASGTGGDCTISTTNLSGITSSELQALNSTVPQAGSVQCGTFGKAGALNPKLPVNSCVITPTLPAVSQDLNCSNQCSDSTKFVGVKTPAGGCNCISVPPPPGITTVTVSINPPPPVTALTEAPVVVYYNYFTGKSSSQEKDFVQQQCNKVMGKSCDATTLNQFAEAELGYANPSLYKTALGQLAATAPVPVPQSAPVVEGGDCTANCPKSSVYTYKGTIHNNACQCSATNALPAPASAPASHGPSTVNPTGGYGQLDQGISDIKLPNGQTMGTDGCGVIAFTNLADKYANQNYTPAQAKDLFKASDYGPKGLGSTSDSALLSLLTNNTYNSTVNLGFKAEDYRRSVQYHLYSDMGTSSDTFLIGSSYVYGTKSGNAYVSHITYLTKDPNNKDTFILQPNDYFGKGLTCKPGQTNKGEGFNCSNTDGSVKVSIPTNNQNTYILHAPNP